MIMNHIEATSSRKSHHRTPWNKGKLVGAKSPLPASHVWSIRTKLHMEKRTRDVAGLAIENDFAIGALIRTLRTCSSST